MQAKPMKTSSQRLDQLQDHFFASLEERISRLQAQGREVFRLDMGAPDLPPAPHILEALQNSAEQPEHHSYQPLRGAPALRQAWATHYQQHYAVALDPQQQVLPLMGSKEGIFLITQAVVDPGEVVLIPDPGYLVYTQAARFAQAEPYFMPLRAEHGWLPDLEAIPAAVRQRARLLWLNYPNNPTAASADLEFFARAVDYARAHDLLLCHDAAYSLVTFDSRQPRSILQIPGSFNDSLEFNSLSKAYNMAGWRVGAALGNPAAIQSLFRLLTGLTSGAFRPVHDASIAALTGDQTWIQERNQVYQARRDLALQALAKRGWFAEKSHGALYLWFHIPPGYSTSASFCLALLEKTGVSLTPGSVFGAHGEGYARLAFTLPEVKLQQALNRLDNWK